ncbi:toxin-antitoxin system TumE family protein [Terriglobus sp.]|uniref:toxin-antitoxin system TumE family protein n=1 Tax=Terriglobus sp. TaxID=1889013 RepID=UPI003B00E322
MDRANRVVKYNLAYINHSVCHTDHGRVLGYDNAHGKHERHCMGTVEEVGAVSYEDRLDKFLEEVREWRHRT